MFVRPRVRWQRGCASFHDPDGNGNARDRHKNYVQRGRRREDVAPVQWRAHQAGLHRWRPRLSTELQRPVRPDEIVIAAQEFDVPAELVGATGVAGRSTAQVRRALANREVEALDERRPLYAVPVFVLSVCPQTLQRYRRRRPDFVANQPWPTMLRPGLPKLSHPSLAHAISSIAFIAQVYLGAKPVVSPTTSGGEGDRSTATGATTGILVLAPLAVGGVNVSPCKKGLYDTFGTP